MVITKKKKTRVGQKVEKIQSFGTAIGNENGADTLVNSMEFP